jgi:hypothetical protein
MFAAVHESDYGPPLPIFADAQSRRLPGVLRTHCLSESHTPAQRLPSSTDRDNQEDHHDFPPDAQTHARTNRGQWRRLGGAPCEGSATARPDCRPRQPPIVRSPKFVSFTLTLGGVVPPGASRDYFVARQNLAGLEIRQSLDPTVPRGEIDPGEFE